MIDNAEIAMNYIRIESLEVFNVSVEPDNKTTLEFNFNDQYEKVPIEITRHLKICT